VREALLQSPSVADVGAAQSRKPARAAASQAGQRRARTPSRSSMPRSRPVAADRHADKEIDEVVQRAAGLKRDRANTSSMRTGEQASISGM
jgi:hypothetical protein